MALNLKQRLEQKFEEEIRFFKGMVSQPKKSRRHRTDIGHHSEKDGECHQSPFRPAGS